MRPARPPNIEDLASGRRFAAIALASAAVILLQITLTRLLSVVVWYHWAFFSISLAMLGVGAPGVWFSFVERRGRWPRPLLLAAAVLVPLSIVAIVQLTHLSRPYEMILCLAVLLPGILALGGAVCVLLLDARGSAIGHMYAFDLLGACAGSVLVIPLMWAVPTPQLAGAIGFLPLLAFLLLGGRPPLAAAAAAGIALLIGAGEPFQLRYSKVYAENQPDSTPIYEKWTPTARITVFDSIFWRDPGRPFGWGFGRVRPQVEAPAQYWIQQDGSAGTPITGFDGDAAQIEYLFHDVTSIGYQMRPPQKVAIVGAGGGRDVLTAHLAGAERIDAIELNPAILTALRTRFAGFSGGVYDLPGVRAIAGEGRSVLTRSGGDYDLIQISLVDSWAATAAGAFSLSENNLYTLESYRLYWSKLSRNGLVSTTRWLVGTSAMEMARLLFLVRAALEAEGVEDPDRHLAVVQGSMVGTVLVSRTPLQPGEIDALHRISELRGFDLHMPEPSLPPERQILRRLVALGPDVFREGGIHLDPPTDDKPFFFQVLSPFERAPEAVVTKNGVNAEGIVMLRQLMIVMTIVTLVLFFAPFALGRWMSPTADFWRGSLFFVAIGLGFLLVEIPWIQRFILYLGHPSWATTVCLGSMLLGAGVGSLCSERLGVAGGQRLGWLVPAIVLGVNAALAPIFETTLGWGWAARVLVTLALIAPAGFTMGFLFPLGMVRFGDARRPWFWALNGAAGVLASALSLALSMEIGFSKVAYAGAAIYVGAWLLLRGAPVGATRVP